MRMCLVVSIFIFALPFLADASSVVINEVMFDPAGDDSVSGVGKEWIEIYNGGDESADLTAWQLYPDGIGYFNFPKGFLLAPKNMVVIHLRASGTDSATDLYFSGAGSNMGNTSGSAALFSAEPRGKDTIKSFVEWGKGGETWESDAGTATLWGKGTFIDLSSFHEGSSIALRLDGNPTNGKDAWMVDSSPTQGIFNADALSPASVQSAPMTPPPPPPPPPPLAVTLPPPSFIFPTIKVFAGEDVTTVTGAETSFLGSAFGTNDKPVENARFWWNFGDGQTKEGKSVTHSFKIPGKYMVGLHVSFDGHAVSDYLHVYAVPNKIYVSNVLMGESGSVYLNNPMDMDIEIGSWTIEDSGGNSWVMPPKTKIGARSEIGFANDVTGLLKGTSSSLTVRFPNASVAFTQELHGLPLGMKPVPDSSDTRLSAAGASAVSTKKPENKVAVKEKKLQVSGNESEKEMISSRIREDATVDTLPATVSEPVRGTGSFYFFFAAAGLSVAAAVGFFIIKSFFF